MKENTEGLGKPSESQKDLSASLQGERASTCDKTVAGGCTGRNPSAPPRGWIRMVVLPPLISLFNKQNEVHYVLFNCT
jgi:hypothetical protein